MFGTKYQTTKEDGATKVDTKPATFGDVMNLSIPLDTTGNLWRVGLVLGLAVLGSR